jgi:hypothetical protein
MFPRDLPVATQVWVAFRYLLRHNGDLLYMNTSTGGFFAARCMVWSRGWEQAGYLLRSHYGAYVSVRGARAATLRSTLCVTSDIYRSNANATIGECDYCTGTWKVFIA